MFWFLMGRVVHAFDSILGKHRCFGQYSSFEQAKRQCRIGIGSRQYCVCIHPDVGGIDIRITNAFWPFKRRERIETFIAPVLPGCVLWSRRKIGKDTRILRQSALRLQPKCFRTTEAPEAPQNFTETNGTISSKSIFFRVLSVV